MKRTASTLIASLLWVGFLTVAVSPLTLSTAAYAQRGAEQRSVEGKVQDKSGAPVKGATVFLKDTRTLAVKTFLSTDDGNYRIGQLSPSADYELWAELNGKKSGTHPISSFDTKKEVTINLKIDTGK